MGRRVGNRRYELGRRLGHGGMATVYAAQDHKLDREVAGKLLADSLAGADHVRRRLARETSLAARLHHPHLVRVYDLGEARERPFIVMERGEGCTLEERLAREGEPVSGERAVDLLRQLCEGLGHAHSRRLVHRDVKPGNLLLRETDGCLKVADFGIARALEDTRLTRTGKVIGTDRYMSPEQLADGTLTAASDVWACGVVADEVLPSDRSPALKAIVERCLQRHPEGRFEDAAALGRALST